MQLQSSTAVDDEMQILHYLLSGTKHNDIYRFSYRSELTEALFSNTSDIHANLICVYADYFCIKNSL